MAERRAAPRSFKRGFRRCRPTQGRKPLEISNEKQSCSSPKPHSQIKQPYQNKRPGGNSKHPRTRIIIQTSGVEAPFVESDGSDGIGFERTVGAECVVEGCGAKGCGLNGGGYEGDRSDANEADRSAKQGGDINAGLRKDSAIDLAGSENRTSEKREGP